ncbi:hydrogenase maturation protease [Gallaecimonas kandeliae]|uniref:hydrogenase maturation protease n=1 Tax=Gallaecimonas kandeliae TaxID=3029055 RepID=UPI0026493DC5|nr:hydrogenase maturation protease [Gallaecimonas kandeliae]WKE64224.1 hydrogenase maturation protease [Gallaecimonas kandeliae]
MSLCILGIGNPLHGDDGFGQEALAQLAAYPWPEDTQLLDGGTGGVTLLPRLKGCQRLVLLDVGRGGKPGTVRHYRRLRPWALGDAGCLDHGGGAAELLALLALQQAPPQVDLVVVMGKRFKPYSPGLSPEVAAALPGLCHYLYHYLTGF